MSPPTATPSIICVFDGPRTCSQLFNKLFAAHDKLHQVFHPYMGCSMYGPERVTALLGGSQTSRRAMTELAATYDLHNETYGAASDRLRSNIAEAHEDGNIAWIKDHLVCLMRVDLMLNAYQNGLDEHTENGQNPTMIPDELFWNMIPIILIRHPALRVPAYYRAQRHVFKEQADEDIFEAMATSRWAQMVFDTYRALSEAAEPIVIDAEDVVHHTKPLKQKLCALLSIDANGVQYEWDAVPRENWPSDPIMQGFFKTLLKSDGVQRDEKAAEIDLYIGHEAKQWEHEFSHETAMQIRKIVDRDLSIYEQLRQHKVKL